MGIEWAVRSRVQGGQGLRSVEVVVDPGLMSAGLGRKIETC